MKTCSNCGEVRPKEVFYRDKNKADGCSSWCKECTKEINAQWYTENREKAKVSRTKWHKDNKEIVRNRKLILRYGITLDQYNDLFSKQKGCCAICEEHQDTFSRALAVDHCHKTGKVRGLLCVNCNSALGKLKENIQKIIKAAEYLTKYSD